ncbi:Hint domain-containing protein [Gymnodinialimonas hymeniacidonis]|uniref:Hint domain-containing protein n=1 Tax=Gymnodinialimonas hymeniacidonis TaxID=3126508 RepID=UPI0034C60DF7
MPTYDFYIYSGDALPYDPNTGSFTFDQNYDASEDRVKLSITDDDVYLDGDEKADEVGEDANQTGVATTADGTPISSGQIYAEQYGILQAPDGSYIYIDRIEIDGELIGYSPSQELTPGVSYTYVGGSDIDNAPGGDSSADNRMTYSQYQAQSVPCFVSGTLLLTRDGMTPVDWISVGDEVWTLDHGWQPVRWHGLRPFDDGPDLPRPVEIQPGALGSGTPAEVVRLSPQHRVLLCNAACELFFGANEVLVAAKHLLHWPGVTEVALDADYAYHHLLFDRHEVVAARNFALESLYLGDQIRILRPAPPWWMSRALAEGHARTARRCLTAREARTLRPGYYPARFAMPEQMENNGTDDAWAAIA